MVEFGWHRCSGYRGAKTRLVRGSSPLTCHGPSKQLLSFVADTLQMLPPRYSRNPSPGLRAICFRLLRATTSPCRPDLGKLTTRRASFPRCDTAGAMSVACPHTRSDEGGAI